MKHIIRQILFMILSVFLVCNLTSCGSDFHFVENKDLDTLEAIDVSHINDDLIEELNLYMKEFFVVGMEVAPVTYEERLHWIHSSNDAYYIHVLKDRYYYVSGYLDKEQYKEYHPYYYSENYEWVGYQNAEDIVSRVGTKEHVITFQLNQALVTKLVEHKKRDLPYFEYYQEYEPTFSESGINTNVGIEYENWFICLDDKKPNRLYKSLDYFLFRHSMYLPCVCLDDEIYFYFNVSIKNKDGTIDKYDLKKEFGIYYFRMKRVMISNRYRIEEDNGRVLERGIISLENFVKLIA